MPIDLCNPCAQQCPGFVAHDLTFRTALLNVLCNQSTLLARAAGSEDLRGFGSVASGQTDAPLIAAVAGKKIVITAILPTTDAANTTFQFRSKPVGVGSNISPVYDSLSFSGYGFNYNPAGWYATAVGEGFSVTTGAGSADFTYTYRLE